MLIDISRQDEWFEANKAAFAELLVAVDSAERDKLERLSYLKVSVYGAADAIGGLNEVEHAAAMLQGRGCTAQEIIALLDNRIQPGDLLRLSVDPLFQDVVSRHRTAWASEQLSRRQRELETMPVKDAKDIATIVGALRAIIQDQVKLEATQVAMAQRTAEMNQRARKSEGGSNEPEVLHIAED